MDKRFLASMGAVVAIFTMVVVFQNCSSLDSPGSSGGGNFSSYEANVSIADVAIAPGQVANVLVVLDQPLANSVTVSFRTLDDTAIAGTHYQTTDSTIELPAGQTTFQFAITTLVSAADFNNKRFRVQVSFAGNVAPTVTSYVSFTAGNSGLTFSQRSSNSGLLSAGQFHSCAIKNDALSCWGRNTEGQLGQGNNTNRTFPGTVASMETGVSAVSAGRLHTCAIKSGALYCWGFNSGYQLGDGTATNSTFARAVFDMGSGVQAVSAGYDHTCAIKNGALYCWGTNNMAQVGHNNGANQQVPLLVPNFTTGVTAVAAGYQHTCAIKNGGLYCWGLNSQGQLALGNTTNDPNRNPANPAVTIAPITGFETGVLAVSATSHTTCASKGAGALYCWGYNASGQLGLGNATNTSAPNLINGFDLGVSHFSSAVSHTCAIKTTGLHCWGYNGNGQLGNNTAVSSTAPAATPVSVTLNAGESFVHVVSGGHGDTVNRQSHTCGRTNQNRVFCWGYNGFGEVGDNTVVQKLVPTLIGL